jgi:hypothetical protein
MSKCSVRSIANRGGAPRQIAAPAAVVFKGYSSHNPPDGKLRGMRHVSSIGLETDARRWSVSVDQLSSTTFHDQAIGRPSSPVVRRQLSRFGHQSLSDHAAGHPTGANEVGVASYFIPGNDRVAGLYPESEARFVLANLAIR